MFIKFKNIDSHYIISFFGLTIKIKHKNPKIKDVKLSLPCLNTNPRTPKIILSLTTFPDRINSVSKTIKTLLNQTLKPDKVILWLAFEQFPKKEQELPNDLLELKNFGLDIKWCEDIKSYKKLIPSLIEFENDIIITFDDDIYYDENIVKRLYDAHLEDREAVVVNRYSRIYFKNDKMKFLKSSKLYFSNPPKPSLLNVIIGCGGVLYPPKSLSPNVLNKQEFMSLIPTHDDIWFWLNAILNNTKIKIVDGFSTNLIPIENTQQFGLCKINNKSKNGINALDALRIITNKYPLIIKKLKEEDTNLKKLLNGDLK